MSAPHTVRDLIARVAPAKSTPSTLKAANWSLAAAVAFSLVTICCGGAVALQPALGRDFLPAALYAYIISLGMLTLWSGLNFATLITVLWKSDHLLASQVDAQIRQDQALIDTLVSQNELGDLQRLRRQIAFEGRMIEGFGGTVTKFGALVAALAATATSLTIAASQVGDMLKFAGPAILLGVCLAGALKHSFGQRLLRLEFVLSEAERELTEKQNGPNSS